MNICPAQTTGLDITEVEDGLVVYVASTRRVHHLNVTATLVFELCTGDNDLAAIAQFVQTAFGLEHPPTEDVTALLESFTAELMVAESPADV